MKGAQMSSKPPKIPKQNVRRRRKPKPIDPDAAAAFVDGGIERLQETQMQNAQMQESEPAKAVVELVQPASAQNADAETAEAPMQDVQALMAQVAATSLPDARLHVYVRGDIMMRMKILKSLRPTGQRSLKSMVEEALLAYLESNGA